FMLRATLLGDHDQAAGWMPPAHGRAGFIALLPTGTTGSIGIDLALSQQLGIGQRSPRRPRMEDRRSTIESGGRSARARIVCLFFLRLHLHSQLRSSIFDPRFSNFTLQFSTVLPSRD